MLDDFQEAIGQANLLNGFDLNADRPDELEQTQGDARAPEGVPARLLDQRRAAAAERHRLGPPRLERRHRQHAQPGQEEPGELPLPDLRGGHPGRLGLHGDPLQREAPGHRARCSSTGCSTPSTRRRTSPGSATRCRSRAPRPRSPSSPRTIRRSRSRPRTSPTAASSRSSRPRGKQGVGPGLDGGQGVTDAFWRRFLVPGALWLLLFFVVPLGITIAISLGQQPSSAASSTASTPATTPTRSTRCSRRCSLRSVGYAAATAAICLLIGYPVAYCIARYGGRRQATLLIAAVLLAVPHQLPRAHVRVGRAARRRGAREPLSPRDASDSVVPQHARGR